MGVSVSAQPKACLDLLRKETGEGHGSQLFCRFNQFRGKRGTCSSHGQAIFTCFSPEAVKTAVNQQSANTVELFSWGCGLSPEELEFVKLRSHSEGTDPFPIISSSEGNRQDHQSPLP